MTTSERKSINMESANDKVYSGINKDNIVNSNSYDEYFTVYDPGTQIQSKGECVNFTNCATYNTYGGLDTVTYIDYFIKK